MRIAILNWTGGENDPFTPFNATIRNQLARLGRETVLITKDKNLGPNLEASIKRGIDFALTFQGLGSALKAVGSNVLIWDMFKVPLFCLHGDHPSQMPANHSAQSDYVIHTYCVSSFTHYANRHIPRRRPAMYFKLPMLNEPAKKQEWSGNYFCLPKNLDDTPETYRSWKARFNANLHSFLTHAADAISHSLSTEETTDHHAIVDALMSENENFLRLKAAMNIADELQFFHDIHRELNKFYRNALAQQVLEELEDVPIRIYGRGWERHAARGNKNHLFCAFDKAENADFQYFSNYGIIDIAPAFDSLHDRTLRALANRSAFLIASAWPHKDGFGEDYGALFFNGNPGRLRDRVEKVLADPTAHREQCVRFGLEYRNWASYYDFLRTFELLRATFSK